MLIFVAEPTVTEVLLPSGDGLVLQFGLIAALLLLSLQVVKSEKGLSFPLTIWI